MANEKRLIDANALLRRLQKRREDFAGAWKTLDAMPVNAQIQYHENLECSLIVEDIPIVDAVEVVRCKDCHWWRKVDRLKGSGLCRHTVFSIDDCTVDPTTNPDDFCSYGERRNND